MAAAQEDEKHQDALDGFGIDDPLLKATLMEQARESDG